jgi:hypothetical protein
MGDTRRNGEIPCCFELCSWHNPAALATDQPVRLLGSAAFLWYDLRSSSARRW